MSEATALHWMLPDPGKCGECGAANLWTITTVGRRVTATLALMHSCQCPQSLYQKELAACKAKGGHFPQRVGGGQHSWFECRECGHDC